MFNANNRFLYRMM